jgi:hypothetical protein
MVVIVYGSLCRLMTDGSEDVMQQVHKEMSLSKEQVREPQLAADASAQVQSIEEIRARLEAFRTEETLRYERAKREREELTPVEEPDIVFVEWLCCTNNVALSEFP